MDSPSVGFGAIVAIVCMLIYLVIVGVQSHAAVANQTTVSVFDVELERQSFTSQGHRYIAWRTTNSTNRISITHDPECPCQKKLSAENNEEGSASGGH